MALQDCLKHNTGSYWTGGNGREVDSLRGVNRQPMGMTILAASTRVKGQTFQLNRTPSTSSAVSMKSCRVDIGRESKVGGHDRSVRRRGTNARDSAPSEAPRHPLVRGQLMRRRAVGSQLGGRCLSLSPRPTVSRLVRSAADLMLDIATRESTSPTTGCPCGTCNECSWGVYIHPAIPLGVCC